MTDFEKFVDHYLESRIASWRRIAADLEEHKSEWGSEVQRWYEEKINTLRKCANDIRSDIDVFVFDTHGEGCDCNTCLTNRELLHADSMHDQMRDERDMGNE